MDTLKLLFHIDGPEVCNATNMRGLGRCIFRLISDCHRVMVVQGSQNLNSHQPKSVERNQANGCGALVELGMAEVQSMIHANKRLTSQLNIAGVPAFGFCGLDGDIVHLRLCSGSTNTCDAEVASVSPFWLNVVTENGGVPVLCNIGVTADSSWKVLNSDQLAVKCAVAWNADALIFVIAGEGVRSDQGSVLRWLNVADIHRTGVSPTEENIVSKLHGCRQALEAGVHRTRIYPVAHIEHLSDFYFAAIEYGTEVIKTGLGSQVVISNGGSSERLAGRVVAHANKGDTDGGKGVSTDRDGKQNHHKVIGRL